MNISDTKNKYMITRIDGGPLGGRCTMQALKNGSVDESKPSIMLNLDLSLIKGMFTPTVDEKKQLKLEALKESLEEIREDYIKKDLQEFKNIDVPDYPQKADLLLRQAGLKDGFDKAVSLLLDNVEKSRTILKLANQFVNEVEHSERTSFAEPMGHEDCKRYAKAFGKVL